MQVDLPTPVGEKTVFIDVLGRKVHRITRRGLRITAVKKMLDIIP